MIPELPRFFLTPSVFVPGKNIRFRLMSAESRYRFSPDVEYRLEIWPMENWTPACKENAILLRGTEDGCLEWDCDLEEEGPVRFRIVDYHPILSHPTVETLLIHAYGIREEYFRLRPRKGDLHIHTCRSDGRNDPAAVASRYRAQGFDFISVTDHNRMFPSVETEKAVGDLSCDLKVFPGEEVHAPGSNVHIVHPLASKSITEIYCNHRAEYEEEIAALEETYPESPYRARLARAEWVRRKAGEDLLVFPHPFWEPNGYNVPTALSEQMFRSGWFDAFELIGAQTGKGANLNGSEGNNLALNFWEEMGRKGIWLPVISDSDSHKTSGTLARFSDQYTLVFPEEFTRQGLIDAIRKGMCVAVEHIPDQPVPDYHAYGTDFRLVSYARFLINEFYPKVEAVGRVEGALMEAALLYGDDGAAEALKLLRGREDRLWDRFIGKDQSILMSEAYRERCREGEAVWNAYGAHTMGSLVEPFEKK